MHTFSFFLLITPQQKRKSPVKSLATIGGALHSLLGFLFAVSSFKRKIKDLCSISLSDNLHSPFHQNLTVAKCRECYFCCLCPQVDGISSHHKGSWYLYSLGCSLYRSNPRISLCTFIMRSIFDVVSTA